MADTTFDPAVFENLVVEGANETKSTPVPEGDYAAIIDAVRVKSIDISKGDRAGQTVPILEVTWHILDEDGKLGELLNRDKVTVRQDIWLDIVNGGLAFGPNLNLALGRLREALDLNKPNKPFTFKMLEGQGPATITVGQRTQESSGDVFNQVNRVSKQ